MSESDVGLSVAETRQNGSSFRGPLPPRPPGWVKPPAGTTVAPVIDAFGSASERRLSHVRAGVCAPARLDVSSVIRAMSVCRLNFGIAERSYSDHRVAQCLNSGNRVYVSTRQAKQSIYNSLRCARLRVFHVAARIGVLSGR